MAAGGLILAAQQAGMVKVFSFAELLDPAVGHELEKLPFKTAPIAALLLDGIQQGLRGGKFGDVHIINPADDSEEVMEIVLLGKTRQLRHVVEPNVHDALHLGFLQPREEMLRRRLREANGKHVHGLAPRRACRGIGMGQPN